MSATKRVLLHRRAAEMLRGLYAGRESEGAATITHHLVAGGAEPELIARYAALAGDYAYAVCAYPEAERHYRLAIENLERLAITALPYERLAYLLERLGECVRIQGQFKEARTLFERALDARERQPLSTKSGEEADQAFFYEMQVRARLWSEVGWTWFYMGDHARAHQYCDRGEELLRATGITDGPVWARLSYQRGYIYNEEGHYDEALAAGREAQRTLEEALRRQAEEPGPLSELAAAYRIKADPVELARIYRFLGTLEYNLGRISEALSHLNQALKLLEPYNHKREVAHVCCNIGHAHLEKTEYALAREYFQRSLTLAEEIGDAPLSAVIFSNLGQLAARAGDLRGAESWLRRGLALIEEINDQVYICEWHAELAAILQDQGRLTEAGEAILRALKTGRAINNAPCVGRALVALGDLRIDQALTLHEALDRAGPSTPAPPSGHPQKPVGAGQAPPASAPGAASDAYSAEAIRNRYLRRAQASLRHALRQEGVRADAQVAGQLALARTSLLLAELAPAREQVQLALELARRYELTWLYARAQAVLGSILAVQGDQEGAGRNFEEALRLFRSCGMRLDEARTLQRYGRALLAFGKDERAHTYLNEARRIFEECRAPLDVALIERLTSNHAPRRR